MDSEVNFQKSADKFLQSEATIVELSDSFSQLIDEVRRRCDSSKNEDRDDNVEILLSSINRYLQCIIKYAEDGNAQERASNLHQLCNKIHSAVKESKIKYAFRQSLSIGIFDFMFGQPIWIAKEILRMYSCVLEDIDCNVGRGITGRIGCYYLGRLMDKLPFGDFEFQCIILATLMRLSSINVMKSMPSVLFLSDELREAFYNIDTKNMMYTRHFLNLLNETENHVMSLLCNKVTFDDYRLQKPHELASFEGLWVDFNVKAGSVTLFIDNEVFNGNNSWNIITIYSENISSSDASYLFTEENETVGVLRFNLKEPCHLLNSPSNHELQECRLLTLYTIDTIKFKDVFNQALPEILNRFKEKQSRSSYFEHACNRHDMVSVKDRMRFRGSMDTILMSKTISSRQSALNSSINDLTSFKHDENKLKRGSSSCSNSSEIEQSETGNLDDTAGPSKKMRYSTIERKKDNTILAYSQDFSSGLVQIDEHDNAFGECNDNLDANSKRRGKFRATDPNLQKRDNSKTSIGRFHSSNLFIKDESILSEVTHYIEDINTEQRRKIRRISGDQKLETHGQEESTVATLESNKDEIISQTLIEAKAKIEKIPSKLCFLGMNVANKENITENVKFIESMRFDDNKAESSASSEISNSSLINRNQDRRNQKDKSEDKNFIFISTRYTKSSQKTDHVNLPESLLTKKKGPYYKETHQEINTETEDDDLHVECKKNSPNIKENPESGIKIISDINIKSPILKCNSKKESEIGQDKDVIPSSDEDFSHLKQSHEERVEIVEIHSIDQLDPKQPSEKEVELEKSIETAHNNRDNESTDQNLNNLKANLKTCEEQKVKKRRKRRTLMVPPTNKKNKRKSRAKVLVQFNQL